MSARLRMIGLVVVTIACLALALWGVDFGRVWQAMTQMRFSYALPAMLAVTLAFLFRVIRFQLLLGEHRPSFRRQLVVCAIAFLGINVVPLRLGEFVRSFMLLEDGVEWGTSLGAVVVERMVDLFSLLTMLVLVSLVVELPAVVVVQGVDVMSAAQKGVGVVLVVLMCGMVGVMAMGTRVVPLVQSIPKVGKGVATFLMSFRTSAVALVADPLRALGVVGSAVLVWVSVIASAYFLLLAFDGLPVGWDVALALTAFTCAGMVAIPTPGFFGPFEVFCKAVLVLYAVDSDLAATFAIVWHLHQFGFHVLTGGAMLLTEGLSLGELVRGSQNAG